MCKKVTPDILSDKVYMKGRRQSPGAVQSGQPVTGQVSSVSPGTLEHAKQLNGPFEINPGLERRKNAFILV